MAEPAGRRTGAAAARRPWALAVPGLLALALAACNPPAADHYVARISVAGPDAPSSPNPSPDVTGAVWVPSATNGERLLYGRPGERPLFTLQCRAAPGQPPRIEYTRPSPADPRAQAILALIGNGHVARLRIDAVPAGEGTGGTGGPGPGATAAGWIWRGSEDALSPAFESLTGGRPVEATVPGAGSLILNPGPLPGELVTRCRARARPAGPASTPAATGAAAPLLPDTTGTAAPPLPPAPPGTA